MGRFFFLRINELSVCLWLNKEWIRNLNDLMEFPKCQVLMLRWYIGQKKWIRKNKKRLRIVLYYWNIRVIYLFTVSTSHNEFGLKSYTYIISVVFSKLFLWKPSRFPDYSLIVFFVKYRYSSSFIVKQWNEENATEGTHN